MPLPDNGIAWPPAQLANITPAMDSWQAWWIGDTGALEKVYTSASARVRPSQMAGGIVGATARFFWGRPQSDQTQKQQKVHVPIAASICRTSADLLYGEAPKFTVPHKETQARLDEFVDDGLLQTLTSAAEAGAALGGYFLRVSWDETVRRAPFITSVLPNAALPTFDMSGGLKAVTFWHVVGRKDSTVWRHLEHHELDDSDVGMIYHAVYEGTSDNLGHAVPLAEVKATEALAKEVDENGAISTMSPGLAVVYVPNRAPAARWIDDPLGCRLGKSDLDGIEELMDALDEVETSFMRDVRLGKARVYVARNMVENTGPGMGGFVDMDAEVLSPLNALSNATDGRLPITPQQFDIRHEEHIAAVQHLRNLIIDGAGYSPASFGDDTDGGLRTATEVRAIREASFSTRDRKLRGLRPALGELLEKMLAVDAAVFGTADVVPQRPEIDFPDGIQESPQTVATTLQALDIAGAISTASKVRRANPEWDDAKIAEEVRLILQEKALPVLTDPMDPSASQPDSPIPPVA